MRLLPIATNAAERSQARLREIKCLQCRKSGFLYPLLARVESRLEERTLRYALISGLALGFATPALAAETLTYTYDAKGRVVKVVHSGTVNNALTYDYTHDKADNRTHVKVTNSPH